MRCSYNELIEYQEVQRNLCGEESEFHKLAYFLIEGYISWLDYHPDKMGVVGSSPTLSTKNIMGLNGIERYASGKGQAVGIHFKQQKKNKRRERRFSCLRVRYSCVSVSREARLLGTEHPSNFFLIRRKVPGSRPWEHCFSSKHLGVLQLLTAWQNILIIKWWNR